MGRGRRPGSERRCKGGWEGWVGVQAPLGRFRGSAVGPTNGGLLLAPVAVGWGICRLGRAVAWFIDNSCFVLGTLGVPSRSPHLVFKTPTIS